MADHLTEEEQIAQLKQWWKENGASLLIAILLGLIAYFGFQWWQSNQTQQAEQASITYAELLSNVNQGDASPSEKNIATIHYLAEELQNNYPSSQYAANASLFSAKLAVDNGELDQAADTLAWVIGNAHEDFRTIAQLRLARVYISQEKYEQALSLTNEEEGPFLSINAEIRGDIFVAKAQWQEARAAYQTAIDSLQNTNFRSRLLPIKLANIPAEDQ